MVVKAVPPTVIPTVPAILLAPEVVTLISVIVPNIPFVVSVSAVAGLVDEPNCCPFEGVLLVSYPKKLVPVFQVAAAVHVTPVKV